MTPNLHERRYVCIVWNDAHGSATAEYAEHELPHQPCEYASYGFVMKDDEAGITLANEVSESQTYRQTGFIPRGMIVEVIELTVSRKRKRRQAASSPPPTSVTSVA